MECGPLSLWLTFSLVKRAQLTYNANANKRANIANAKVCGKLAKSRMEHLYTTIMAGIEECSVHMAPRC